MNTSVVRARTTLEPRRALIAFSLAACLVLLLPTGARATTLEKLGTADLTRRSVAVIAGSVTAISVDVVNGEARTAVTFAVSRSLKGAATRSVTAYVPGGRLPNGLIERVDDMPTFTLGERCVVFIDRHGWVVGGEQGKVAVDGDRLRGSGRPLADLEAAVQAVDAGLTATSDPLVALPSLQASVVSAAAPTITEVGPDPVAAGIGARVTILGSGFGSTPGSVTFFYQTGQPRLTATIDSWTDTAIVCVVPVGSVNGYPASSGSDPLIVTTSAGLQASHTIGILFGDGNEQWKATYPASPHTRVTYRVNPGAVASAEALVDAAAAVWSAAGADFSFLDGGTFATTAPATADGVNDIQWVAGLPAGVLAQATMWVWPDGTIGESHVTFNADYAWGDGSPGTIDIETVALHELGHWLSLRDLYGSGDRGKAMYGFCAAGTRVRTLSAGDLAGILHIYPAPIVSDLTAPVTTSDATATYAGQARIALSASDAGGSGVAATYYRLDGGPATAGTVLTVGSTGTHSLEFWSVDRAGNEETPHNVAAFTVTYVAPPAPVATWISIGRSAASVKRGRPVVLYGTVSPGSYGDPVLIQVRAGRIRRWSNLAVTYATGSDGSWSFAYATRRRNTYTFRAIFLGAEGRLSSGSGTVSVRVR